MMSYRASRAIYGQLEVVNIADGKIFADYPLMPKEW
jgi:hypothetical protein